MGMPSQARSSSLFCLPSPPSNLSLPISSPSQRAPLSNELMMLIAWHGMVCLCGMVHACCLECMGEEEGGWVGKGWEAVGRGGVEGSGARWGGKEWEGVGWIGGNWGAYGWWCAGRPLFYRESKRDEIRRTFHEPVPPKPRTVQGVVEGVVLSAANGISSLWKRRTPDKKCLILAAPDTQLPMQQQQQQQQLVSSSADVLKEWRAEEVKEAIPIVFVTSHVPNEPHHPALVVIEQPERSRIHGGAQSQPIAPVFLLILCSPSPPAPLPLLLTFPSCSPSPPAHLPLLLPFPSCSPSPPAPLPLLLTFPSCSPSPPAPLPLLLPFPSCSPSPPAHLPLLLTFPSCSPSPPAHLPLLLPFPSCSPSPPAPLPLLLPFPSCSPSPPAPLPLLLPFPSCSPSPPAPLSLLLPFPSCSPSPPAPLPLLLPFPSCSPSPPAPLPRPHFPFPGAEYDLVVYVVGPNPNLKHLLPSPAFPHLLRRLKIAGRETNFEAPQNCGLNDLVYVVGPNPNLKHLSALGVTIEGRNEYNDTCAWLAVSCWLSKGGSLGFLVGVTIEGHNEYDDMCAWLARKMGVTRIEVARPWILAAFMERHNFSRVLSLSIDVMLYVNVSQMVAWMYPSSKMVLPVRWPSMQPPPLPSQYTSTAVSNHAALWHIDALKDFLALYKQIWSMALFGGRPGSAHLMRKKEYSEMTMLGWYTWSECWTNDKLDPPCMAEPVTGVSAKLAYRLRRTRFRPKFLVESLCQPRACHNSSWSDEGLCVWDNNFSVATPSHFFRFAPTRGDKCPSSKLYEHFHAWMGQVPRKNVQFLAVNFQGSRRDYLKLEDPDPAKTWGSAVF
ncbi:unnamed protein product [Closterium sp. NIES-65]|nr:unnamed protein product [Closterium sp. NIES-65]